jgi:hypothetical protein
MSRNLRSYNVSVLLTAPLCFGFFAYYEDLDRAVCKEAYENVLTAEECYCDIIDEKFNRLLELRQQIAENVAFHSI